MRKKQKYKLHQFIGNGKIFIFIFLITFILFKPLIQSIQQLYNDDMELCENSEENSEEVETVDDFIDDFRTSNLIKSSIYKASFFNNTCVYYSQTFTPNFILEVTSPPPELG